MTNTKNSLVLTGILGLSILAFYSTVGAQVQVAETTNSWRAETPVDGQKQWVRLLCVSGKNLPVPQEDGRLREIVASIRDYCATQTSSSSRSSKSSSSSECRPVECAAPPQGCKYVDQKYKDRCLVSCGVLKCENRSSSSRSSKSSRSVSSCKSIECPARQGCRYIDAPMRDGCKVGCGYQMCTQPTR